MKPTQHSRRDFLRVCVAAGAPAPKRPAVSVVKIRDGNVARAVEEAIDLLGGIRAVTGGRERIMLKPNLVAAAAGFNVRGTEIFRTRKREILDPMQSFVFKQLG